MSRTLPSPIALRAFEAAARNLSFTRAAQELFVTQSAVSHQVRSLEEHLGVQLFLRLTRQLRLTEAGESLLRVVRESFDRIEEVVEDLKAGNVAIPLRISLTSYFAARWLTRRLGKFCAQHPTVEIHLQLTNGDVDFKRTEVDLAIMWGYGDWPGLDAWELMPLSMIVVCSPSLLAGAPPPKSVEDLAHYPLLHESGRSVWEYYLDAVGCNGMQVERNIIMDDPNVLHQSCIEGQGIALGAEALLADELEQGLLVRPFEQSVHFGGYYIVRPAGVRSRPNVSAFHEWLLEEADESRSCASVDASASDLA